jgi:hypothetical protein
MKLKDILIVGWIVIFSFALIYFMFFVFGKGGQCLKDPAVYTFNELQRQNSAMGIDCSCSFTNGDVYIFNSNKSYIKVFQRETPTLNFTLKT